MLRKIRLDTTISTSQNVTCHEKNEKHYSLKRDPK